VSQVQQATQTATNLETVGSSGPQATQLETPAPATSSQPTGTITQIHIGCLAQCFGTTTTSTLPAPVAQQIIAELSSLVPPAGSTNTQPSAGLGQTVIDQASCQVQTGGPAPGTQAQAATQTSTTIQLIDLSGGAQPTPNDDTEQQAWQLQIGCLFYCTDTRQVQQAQQAITAIQVLVGQPGSSTSSTASTSSATGATGVASQVIWQLQIGCIAWCYDATQVQDGTSQTTVIVITPTPPGPAPAPAPPPAETNDDPAPGPTPADAPAAAASAPATVAPPAPTTTSSPSTGSSSLPTVSSSLAAVRAGVAVLDRRTMALAAPGLGPVSSQVLVSTVALPATSSEAPLGAPHVLVDHPARPSSVRPSSAHPRRSLRAPAGAVPGWAAPIEAVAAEPGPALPILIAIFGFVAAVGLWALHRALPVGRER
jgi:hypothetical protein